MSPVFSAEGAVDTATGAAEAVLNDDDGADSMSPRREKTDDVCKQQSTDQHKLLFT